MMYMHYCSFCRRIFMLNGHKIICPKCTEPLSELSISYLDYVNLDLPQRKAYVAACQDAEQLAKLTATYRMYKYSKWYRALQENNTENLPVSTLLSTKTKEQQETRIFETPDT